MLWAIMAAVGTVRILGLSRGLPDIIASPGGDEKYFVETALLVAAHRSYSQAFHSLPNFFMPSPYSFLLLIAYGFYFVAGLVAGKFHGVDDLSFQFLADRTMFSELSARRNSASSIGTNRTRSPVRSGK